MTIPEKIILDIWEFIVQNYGMTCTWSEEERAYLGIDSPLVPTYGKELEPFAVSSVLSIVPLLPKIVNSYIKKTITTQLRTTP